MKRINEKFYVFLQSSLGDSKKTELFEYIWNHYSKKITFYISNLIPRQHPFFEDLFQEVMLKIYKNLHSFNPRHSFKAWIYTISRNHCLDFIKNKAEKMRSAQAVKDKDICTQDRPEDIVTRKETLYRIEQYMDSLPGDDREIAYLRFYENLRYRDISRILDMNINTLKSRIRLIRQDLKTSIKGAI